MKQILALGVLAVFLAGCASVQTAALDRGSADLSCPRRSMRVSYAAPDTYRAVGCGKEKTYKCNAPKAMFRPYTCEEAPPVATVATPQTKPPVPSSKTSTKKKAPAKSRSKKKTR